MTLELVLRTSALLVVVWALTRAMPRLTAATRHRLWHGALLVVLAAPLLQAVVPPIRFDVGTANGPAAWGIVPATGADPAALPPAGSPGAANASAVDAASAAFATLGAVASAVDDVALMGSLAVVAWFGVGWWSAARLARRGRPAPLEWRREIDGLARQMRIGSAVDLRMSDDVGGPQTVAVLRPAILLPEAATSWTDGRRRAVLLHELAHVARGDCRTQALTHLACAAYWFNPVVWLAARELRRERERACDDIVLARGIRPSEYAACLLDVAAGMPRRLRPAAAVAMARRSEVEGRLLAVLADDRPRRPAPAARWGAALTVVFAGVVALGATTQSPAAPPEARVTGGAAALLQEAPARRAPARSPYVRALKDADAQVREQAAIGLALLSDPDVVTPLLDALRDPAGQVREKAAAGLALRRDGRVVPALVEAMRDPDAQVREKAAVALGLSGDERARAALEAALSDPSAQVREKALSGLTMLDLGTGGMVDGEALRRGARRLLGVLLGARE
ncbi:MAG: M56 family metallopeptidase [Acidobacteriota bacterium]